MKKMLLTAGAAFVLVAAFAFAAVQNWQLTDKYSITFSSADVSGIFKKMSGTIAFDEKALAQSKFDIAVEVGSINTGNGLQNKHAKGEEWFDAEKFPLIKFTSATIAKSGAGYAATGTLEVKGTKKQITIPFTFKPAGAGAEFAAIFNVNRNDFKVGKPGGEVADVIKIEISAPVVKK